MRFFMRHLRATRSGVLMMLIVQGALFLFGVFIVLAVNATLNDERDYAAIGSTMALMGSIFGGLLRGSGAPVRYRMAVSMGHTRRAYLLADPLITAVNSLVGIGAAWVLNKLELGLYSQLYQGWELEFDIFSVAEWWTAKWWFWLIFIGGIVMLDFCMGALQLRFGAKGFALVWLPLCFAPSIFIQGVNAAQEGSASLLAQMGRAVVCIAGLLSPVAWSGVGAVLLLALLALSARCYLRAEVRM